MLYSLLEIVNTQENITLLLHDVIELRRASASSNTFLKFPGVASAITEQNLFDVYKAIKTPVDFLHVK
jgi:hypothetical protein